MRFSTYRLGKAKVTVVSEQGKEVVAVFGPTTSSGKDVWSDNSEPVFSRREREPGADHNGASPQNETPAEERQHRSAIPVAEQRSFRDSPSNPARKLSIGESREFVAAIPSAVRDIWIFRDQEIRPTMPTSSKASTLRWHGNVIPLAYAHRAVSLDVNWHPRSTRGVTAWSGSASRKFGNRVVIPVEFPRAARNWRNNC